MSGIQFPCYVITGDINLSNFNNLYTIERGFIWRGFTHEYEMIPSAANYDLVGDKITYSRTEECDPFIEIRRIAQKIYELNKLQKFPFEIPLLIRKVLFPRLFQSEKDLFKKMGIKEFPDSSLTQAMSLIQHEFGGTSLLDFSINKYKALYFALGTEKSMSKDSKIFGLNVPYFETQKEHLVEESPYKYSVKFDLIYPSYFMNDKIAHQGGVFLYQKFELDENGWIIGDKKYGNIVKFCETHFEEKNNFSKSSPMFKKISINDFLALAEKEGEKSVFYLLLTVPAKEKRRLKAFLDDIGITDNYMMNSIVTKDVKIENYFEYGDGI